MTEAEYRMYMGRVGELAAGLTRIPIDELLYIIDQSDTLGPILEPTAYRNGGARRLEEQRNVLKAAKTLRDSALILELVLVEQANWDALHGQAVGEADPDPESEIPPPPCPHDPPCGETFAVRVAGWWRRIWTSLRADLSWTGWRAL